MKKIILKRILHRDAWRIGVFFDYDEGIRRKVKLITGVIYSSTNKCFYVNDSEDNLKLILRTLRDEAEIDISALTAKGILSDKMTGSLSESDHSSTESEAGVPGDACSDDSKYQGQDQNQASKHDQNRDQNRGHYQDHNPNQFRDQSRDHNRDQDENYFEYDHIPDVGSEDSDSSQQSGIRENNTPRNPGGYSAVEFRTGEKEGSLIIKFTGRYDPEWIGEIKSYGRCNYDRNRREWVLGWSQMKCDSLADYFAGRGIKVNVIKYRVNQELHDERRLTGEEVRSRPLGKKSLDALDAMAEYLDENRYSPRTRESYLAVLEFFFRYYDTKDPAEVTEDEISRFIFDFIIRLGYSASYQNQVVSAIKTYYAISGRGKVNPGLLERPRRQKVLPKVFSKEEVSKILNSSRNVKHKLLLWMIYSCGLRRSEVTNIRLTDLDRERSILHIREGKGGVDRIVPVSGRVWEKVAEYLSSYTPRDYLFEGQAGGRYSVESVYQVFKGALKRAGIKKEVGVHSLRHSYATHLHENGVDIRYIQELLGHRSTRTTEIYTHVSRRNLVAVRSPIEDLDVK